MQPLILVCGSRNPLTSCYLSHSSTSLLIAGRLEIALSQPFPHPPHCHTPPTPLPHPTHPTATPHPPHCHTPPPPPQCYYPLHLSATPAVHPMPHPALPLCHAVPRVPPAGLAVVDKDSTSAELKWEEMSVTDLHGNLTHYSVVIRHDSTIIQRLQTNQTSVVVTGLNKFALHHVQVFAETSAGPGPNAFLFLFTESAGAANTHMRVHAHTDAHMHAPLHFKSPTAQLPSHLVLQCPAMTLLL